MRFFYCHQRGLRFLLIGACALLARMPLTAYGTESDCLTDFTICNAPLQSGFVSRQGVEVIAPQSVNEPFELALQ